MPSSSSTTPATSNITPGYTDYGTGFRTPVGQASSIPDSLLDAGRIALIQGQDYIDVTFNIVQSDVTFEVFPGLIENLIDANPEKVFPTHLTQKSINGVRVVLNAAPTSGNYTLPWRIRPLSVTPST